MTSTVALKVRTIDMHSNISHSQMFYPENMLFKVQHEVAWLSLRQLGGFLGYTFFHNKTMCRLSSNINKMCLYSQSLTTAVFLSCVQRDSFKILHMTRFLKLQFHIHVIYTKETPIYLTSVVEIWSRDFMKRKHLPCTIYYTGNLYVQ